MTNLKALFLLIISLVALFLTPLNHASMSSHSQNLASSSKSTNVAICALRKTSVSENPCLVWVIISQESASDVGVNWYSYVSGNPIMNVDPSGYVTEVFGDSGVVRSVTNDGDNSIIAYPRNMEFIDGPRLQGPPQHFGESMFWDSFTQPEKCANFGANIPIGQVNFGISIDREMSDLVADAKKDGFFSTFYNSRSGRKYDIKTQFTGPGTDAYGGFLYRGKYLSLREAGNVLAGINAAQFDVDYDDFQRAAGALHLGKGKIGVFNSYYLGTEYGAPPWYGEIEYQGTRSRYGYDLYNKGE